MKNYWIASTVILGLSLALVIGVLIGGFSQNTASNPVVSTAEISSAEVKASIEPSPVVTVTSTITATPSPTPTSTPENKVEENSKRVEPKVTDSDKPKSKKTSSAKASMCAAFYVARREMIESVGDINAGGPGGVEKAVNELISATEGLAAALDSSTGALYIDLKDYVFFLRQLPPLIQPTISIAANDVLARARNQASKIEDANHC